MKNRIIWKYSSMDSILCLIAVIQIISLYSWCLHFNNLSLTGNIIISLISILLFYFNPIVIAHNFLHCPFFKSTFLNKFFAIFNSMNFGLPQVLYKYHHIAHHKHSNDKILNHTTQDPSSTYRFGKNSEQEHFILYCGLGLFRDGTEIAFKAALNNRIDALQLYLQLGSSFLFHSLAIYINWQWYLVCYIPIFYFGWFLAHMENYYEHFKATDEKNRFSNSVSYYNKVYNLFMFNEGYHQEHHISPSTHWRKRHNTQHRFSNEMKKNNAYEAKLPPLLGFLD